MKTLLSKIVFSFLAITMGIAIGDEVAKKQRLEPIPPVIFKGKPFFPLGAYDMFPPGKANAFGEVDERFLEAGGNFSDFGGIYLKPEDTNHEGYKDIYNRCGQDVIFAALDKMKNDPRLENVALLVSLGVNVMLEAPDGNQEVGMNTYLSPVSEEKMPLHRKTLTEAVKKLSTYPNVIGYTMDEPENCVWQYYSKNRKEGWEKEKDADLASFMCSTLRWTNDVIRENHPGALRMPIIAWWTTYKQTAELYDVLIANTYPGKKPGMNEFEADLYTVNYDAACQVEAVRHNGNGRSAIFMPPMFDVLTGSKPLSLDEEMYVVFAPITRGVMGIHGWRLQRCSDKHRKFVIYPVMKEVHKLKEFFLGEWYDELVTSDHDTASVDYLKKFQTRIRLVANLEDGTMEEVTKDMVPDVTYCLRKHADGRYLLLAVNNTKDAITVNFDIDVPKPPRTMTDSINASDTVWLKGNKASIKFEPFGVHAYIFK